MVFPTHPTIVREILNSKLHALLRNLIPGDVLEVGAGKFNNYKSETPHKSYVTMDINTKCCPDIVSDICAREYFALSKPVVTTLLGVEGIEVKDMVHCSIVRIWMLLLKN